MGTTCWGWGWGEEGLMTVIIDTGEGIGSSFMTGT